MWPFNRSPEPSPLEQPSPEVTGQYLCRLMAENNSLLRELIAGLTGHQASTRPVGLPRPDVKAIRTDKDVSFVNRSRILQQQRDQEQQARTGAIPANGQASASGPTGNSPEAPSEAPKAIPRSPSL